MKLLKFLPLFFILCVVALSSCAPVVPTMPPPAPATQAAPEASPSVEEIQAVEPEDSAAEPSELAPTEETTETPLPSEAVSSASGTDYCLECHQDQQMLIDTAKPVVEVEPENEGAG